MESDTDDGGRISGGYVLLARKLRESPVWSQDHHHLRLWTYLLLEARWKKEPTVIGGVRIGYGQTLKSYRRIAGENTWTENRSVKAWPTSRVKRMLDWLNRNEMVLLQGTDLGTLITIRNFADYQDPGRYGRGPGTELGTQSERSRNNKKKGNKGNTSLNGEVERPPLREMWDIYISELGGKPPHCELTDERREKLAALYAEKLSRQPDPLDAFRRILQAVQHSDYHMTKRAFQMPESLFKNASRRDRWMQEALQGRRVSGALDRPPL